ncbi:hypothetical protein L917_00081 [Phytophthora nicotianae]|uniref:Uncharacterized protein n=1 Tax=Phytophthora nicotianae TaxID=4792 RepID=W2M250_PHYNI|nr:hypothetical protein L917_00081 [Phytophthora nicotianae]ETM57030.1 hypothetical protein L914_00085 [Phytophthora nicotianae]
MRAHGVRERSGGRQPSIEDVEGKALYNGQSVDVKE